MGEKKNVVAGFVVALVSPPYAQHKYVFDMFTRSVALERAAVATGASG